MANPYTSQSVGSSYNQNPPANDGSEVASNEITWDKHKDKLADPLKTFVEAVNSATSSAFGKLFGNNVSAISSNYTVQASDQGKLLSCTNTITLDLLSSATAGTNFAFMALNAGSGVVTVDGDGSETINGLTTLTLGPGESVVLVSDGTNWSATLHRKFPSRFQSKSGDYTAVLSDDRSWIEFTDVATLTLPAASTAGGYLLGVVNTGSSTVTVDGDGSETINGETTINLAPGESAALACNGSKWLALRDQSDGQEIYKTADQNRISSAVLQDDDHFTGFGLKAGEWYQCRAILYGVSDVSADWSFALTFSNAPQAFHMLVGAAQQDTHSTGTFVAATSGDAILILRALFKANATTGGTVKLQWAQGSSDATTTTLKEGSVMRVRPMRI